MPKIKQSVERTMIDEEGRVLESRQNRVLQWGDEPGYIKLYIKDVLYLQDVPKQYAKLTYALLKHVSYAGDADGMCVVLIAPIKKAICRELGWEKTQSLDNAIKKLVDGKILYRIDRGLYRFNPYLFGKGDWQDIERLRLEVSYDDIKGRTFQTNIEYAHKSDNENEDEDLPGQMTFSDDIIERMAING